MTNGGNDAVDSGDQWRVPLGDDVGSFVESGSAVAGVVPVVDELMVGVDGEDDRVHGRVFGCVVFGIALVVGRVFVCVVLGIGCVVGRVFACVVLGFVVSRRRVCHPEHQGEHSDECAECAYESSLVSSPGSRP